MTNSTLDTTGETPPRRSRAGTRELGPSDSSDSGSDLVGPGGSASDIGIAGPLDTRSHLAAPRSAGADVGDANLDSDSDRNGTGERAAAGRDTSVESGADIAPDRIIELGKADQEASLDGFELTEPEQDETEADDPDAVRSGLSDPNLW